jgi:hypothetical protein
MHLCKMGALAALGLLVVSSAYARNQVWNQADWIVSAGGGSDTITYSGATAIQNGAAAACSIAVIPIAQSTATTLTNVQPGEIVPVAVSKVMQTNTTCTPVFVLGATGN